MYSVQTKKKLVLEKIGRFVVENYPNISWVQRSMLIGWELFWMSMRAHA